MTLTLNFPANYGWKQPGTTYPANGSPRLTQAAGTDKASFSSRKPTFSGEITVQAVGHLPVHITQMAADRSGVSYDVVFLSTLHRMQERFPGLFPTMAENGWSITVANSRPGKFPRVKIDRNHQRIVVQKAGNSGELGAIAAVSAAINNGALGNLLPGCERISDDPRFADDDINPHAFPTISGRFPSVFESLIIGSTLLGDSSYHLLRAHPIPRFWPALDYLQEQYLSPFQASN